LFSDETLKEFFMKAINKENAMKKWMSIVSSIVLLLICFTSAQAKPPVTVKMTKGEAKITMLEGKADVICAGQKEARYLKKHDFIRAGCEVSTGAGSRVEMVLPEKSIIRFAEKTTFKLVQADTGEDGKRAVEVSVTVGKLWTNVRKSLPGRDDKYEVSCQNAVAGVRGTVYRMDVEGDQSALVKVYDGEVRVAAAPGKQQPAVSAVGPPWPVSGPAVIEGPKPVSMEEWVYIIKSMQQIAITSDGQAQEPKEFLESEDMDDWVKWNKKRDKRSSK
jgi:ferric-dicitrate binding protein FerR (iron transport regulator)